MRRAAVVMRRDRPETVGVRDNGAGGKPKADGSQARKGASTRPPQGNVAREKGQRIAPVLPRRRGGGGRVVGEKEKAQKFGWGRGGKREELRGWSVRRERHHSFPEGRRQRRERREEPAGTHSAISGTGPREGERGKWPRGRVGTQHAHAQQLDDAGVWAGATAPGPPGLLVVLAARHTAEGESARDPRCELLSETAATMRVPSECSGAEGRAWRSCVWAAGGGGGAFGISEVARRVEGLSKSIDLQVAHV